MIHNKKVNSIVTELYIRGKSFINHSLDISTKDFTNIYEKYTAEPYYVLFIVTMPTSNNPLRFRKNLFNIYNKNHDNSWSD